MYAFILQHSIRENASENGTWHVKMSQVMNSGLEGE